MTNIEFLAITLKLSGFDILNLIDDDDGHLELEKNILIHVKQSYVLTKDEVLITETADIKHLIAEIKRLMS